MQKEVFIVGEMTCTEDAISNVEDILKELRAQTRNEKGCIYYQFFKAENKTGVFATIEHWDSVAAEAAHWETPHLKEAGKKLQPYLISEMQISRYNRTTGESGCQ
ncbi:putative quinol monooxygenase [Psychroserpens sp. S379A]|uniref:putative quinol monooxygenase n=1 Tax=Psychroserpens sp. S379A TaxID=3415137 RepID=UPI003C7C7696